MDTILTALIWLGLAAIALLALIVLPRL